MEMEGMNSSSGLGSNPFGFGGNAQNSEGITTNAFLLNIATGFVLFASQVIGFFLLKSSSLGRRLYQPKSYLVQDRLRVEAIPVSPWAWLRRIFTIKGEELKQKCGLDGYFAIRFLRAMVVIFIPMMFFCVTILLPINYNKGKFDTTWRIGDRHENFNITGLDTVSWQNVAPPHSQRYWAHLILALAVISWALWRIYREKLHFVKARQDYLTTPEHRLKASARTILVTNIPSEYRSEEALKTLFDVFVDNDDHGKLHVWINRDYKPLKKLVGQRRKYCNALEKEELRLLRMVNKSQKETKDPRPSPRHSPQSSSDTAVSSGARREDESYLLRPLSEKATNSPRSARHNDMPQEEAAVSEKDALQQITAVFKADEKDDGQLWRSFLDASKERQVALVGSDDSVRQTASTLKFWQGGKRNVSKIAWLRAEISRLTVEIDELLPHLDDENRFPLQNSAFVQFDRQMKANMAFALTAHHKPGIMSPRFLDVAPHEVIWPNMGLTSLIRFIRTCVAISIFVGMLILWAIPAFFFATLSQLDALRMNQDSFAWLQDWPKWLISFISGPLSAILLALLIQLVVPALCRKLAVLVGAPTRSRRELVTQAFYFTFLFIELVLVTSISSGLLATISDILNDPASIPSTLATNLPKAANYFFNYLIIQALAFSGSLLFQYLRVLYITLIWPWFTQTPRQEAWLQTTIPHQMWANVFCIWTNFAAIGLIYAVIAPLMLIFVSVVFSLFWIAYRHNYYYVQRNKVDTHGQLFNQALSQLLAGVYVSEITLIGLFFLVRNENANAVCTPQAIIMIVALALTAAYHYVLERTMSPLVEILPVTLEDKATDRERTQFATDGADEEEVDEERLTITPSHGTNAADKPHRQGTFRDGGLQRRGTVSTAANARRMMLRVHERIEARLQATHAHPPLRSGTTSKSRKTEIADELGASLARFPDELLDLSPQERNAEVRAAYQDPVTREPAPVIWLPQDAAGCSEDSVERSKKYGRYLTYSNAGAYMTSKGKCEITQPAPDVRSDFLLDWVL